MPVHKNEIYNIDISIFFYFQNFLEGYKIAVSTVCLDGLGLSDQSYEFA